MTLRYFGMLSSLAVMFAFSKPIARAERSAPAGVDADEVRAIVEEALAYASTRTSLLDSTIAAGHDGDFFLTSVDGSFKLEIAGQIQLRYAFNHQNRPDSDEVDEDEGSFITRRTKLKFKGHLFDRDLTYRVSGAFRRKGGAFVMEDVEVGFRLNDTLVLRVGQFRPPMLREQDVSSRRQLAVERSLVTRALDINRVRGVLLRYQTDRLMAQAAIMDAGGPFGGDEATLVTGRIDAVIVGDDLGVFKDFTSELDEELGILLGGGVVYRFEELEVDTEDEEDSLQWTADLTIERNGASLFASVIGAHVEPAVGGDFNRWGVVVQGGQRITDDFEVFARYEWGDAGDDSDELSLLTVGGSWFMHGHAAKLTIDAGYGFNPVSEFWSSSGAEWRTDASGKDGQFVVRMQWQLLF